MDKDYKKLYEEALERAKYLKENTDSVGAKDISYNFEYIFPELRESEDERIRKEIIELVHFFYCSSSVYEHHVSEDDMISWLEKQGEKSSSWSEKDETQRVNAIIMLKEGASRVYTKDAISKCVDWLKSLKPQNTWKPSEEQMEALEHFVRSIGESGYASPYDNNTKLIHSLLNDLKKL